MPWCCLRVSLLLNLLLAVAALLVFGQKNPIAPPVKPHPPTTNVADPGGEVMAEISTNAMTVTNAVRWAEIESPDFSTYIHNLREIGCPEKTIADIIIADVEELYERKRLLVPLEAKFWESDTQAALPIQKRVEELLRLNQEKTGLLRQLLGVTWFHFPDSDAHTVPIVQFLSGILDGRKAGQVSARATQLDDAGRLLDAASHQAIISKDKLRHEALLHEYLLDLGSVLNEGEIKELKLRNFAMMLAEQFDPLSLQPDELQRTAQLALEAMGDSFAPLGDNEEPLLKTNTLFQARLCELLGTKRCERFQLLQADHSRQIYNWVRNINLPEELSFDLVRLSIQAESDAKMVRETSGNAADSKAALKVIRQELGQAIDRLLGTNSVSFLEANQDWLPQLEMP